MRADPLLPDNRRRERQLWLAALAVQVAIWLSLAPAPILTDFLRQRGLLEVSFLAGTFLVWAAILTQGLQVRPRGLELGVALGVAAAYWMVLVRVEIPEERTHVIEYGVVAILVRQALAVRAGRGLWSRPVTLTAIGVGWAAGFLDEGIQWLLPGRYFAWRDILFNCLAAVMGVAADVTLAWARRKVAGRQRSRS